MPINKVLIVKSKIKKIWFFFLLVLASSCHSVDLESVNNVKITRQGIELDLLIKNPYPVTITLSDFYMNIKVDRFGFNDIEYKPEIRLKPFSEKYYTVNVDIHPLRNFQSSTGAFLAMVGQDSTKLTMDGRAKVKILFLHTKANFHKELYFKYGKK